MPPFVVLIDLANPGGMVTKAHRVVPGQLLLVTRGLATQGQYTDPGHLGVTRFRNVYRGDFKLDRFSVQSQVHTFQQGRSEAFEFALQLVRWHHPVIVILFGIRRFLGVAVTTVDPGHQGLDTGAYFDAEITAGEDADLDQRRSDHIGGKRETEKQG